MNPIIFRKGVCDPHIHIFNNKAYLYATHDAPGYTEGFCMLDWQIWSSEDLIDWELEATIHPEDFYCGSIDQCWAVDAAYKDGKYYLYFSTGAWGVGVAVADSPAGPFVDALGCSIADYHTYPENIPKWDPHVFQDDDGEAYLIVGTCLQEKPWDCYLIARLEHDMIHLAEPFRRVEYEGNPCPEDKPSVHKQNGVYYLTHASYYAVSDNVYGPYIHRGHIGFTNDHGAFFTYHNQTYFAAGGMDNANRYFRSSYLVPCHYRENGDIFIDQQIAAYGCGQYDAAWEKIQADWYFAASRECKAQTENGDTAIELRDGEYAYFPEILNVETNTRMQIYASCRDGAQLLVFEKDPEHFRKTGAAADDGSSGSLLGSCTLDGNPDGGELVYECCLNCTAGKKSLLLKIRGEARISGFSFDNGKKRFTAQTVLSGRGRGASLWKDANAGNHRVLKNLELRGAGFEALMDGGAGGRGRLIVDYCCEKAEAGMELYINGEKQQTLIFPVTGSCISKDAVQQAVEVQVRPGLNRIGLWTKDFQEGKAGIAHITLETEKSCCRVYPAAGGKLIPEGNGCWDGLPQWETEPQAYSGRIVKYLGKPGYAVALSGVDGGEGGCFGLDIHYCCSEPDGSEYEVMVDGISCGKYTFPCTDGCLPEQMKNFRMDVILEKGKTNEIILKKTGNSDSGIRVDAFAVVPV